MKVKVQGKTMKGKNRIKEHGDVWKIVEDSGNATRSTCDILLQSSGGYLKWCEPDFLIVEEINQKIT